MSAIPTSRTNPAPAIRLRSPGQIVAAVPYLVGFHPCESVVAVGLGSQAPQVCLTMRVDLPPPDCSGELAQLIAAHLQNAGSGGVFLVVFSEGPGEPPCPDLVEAIQESSRALGIEVKDALWVRGGRWRSYRCQTPACCPPEGTPVEPDEVSELAAASAWLGDVVHASREDLERSLRPVGLFVRASLERTFEWVSRQLIAELSERGWNAVAAGSRALLRAAVESRAEVSLELRAAEVARLALGLADVAVRDDALMWVGTDLEHAAESLWVELVRKATPPYDAPPATLLAVHAYLRGNGAYARIALDRALASDPDYSFAVLLTEGLDRGVPPKALRAALALSAEAA
jgi:hypothetical protein